jgi:helicase
VPSDLAVDTLFCHGVGDEFLVAASRDGQRVLRGTLELGDAGPGPRPRRFRVRTADGVEPRQPDEFVDIARAADAVRISEQTSPAERDRLRNALDAYGVDATAVRTCRRCAEATRYTPITTASAIRSGDEHVCVDCARRDLDDEAAYHDLSSAARARLADLLREVGDLDRVRDLLRGDLDADLTKFDELDATTDAADPIAVADLDVHPALRERLADRFDTLLPVQSRSVGAGLLDGRDQLVVSATATGKTLIGEIAGIDRALRGEGKCLVLVPLVALANQTYRDFQEDYGDMIDVTRRVGSSRIGGDEVPFDPSADVIVGTYEGIDHALRTGRDLGDVGTVVIDEVHTIGDPDRGHRLDGLIERLRYVCESGNRAARADAASAGAAAGTGDGAADEGAASDAAADSDGDTQWLSLSATVGNPHGLAQALGADLVAFEERPVPIERHVAFVEGRRKPQVIDRLVSREYDHVSSAGYHGQSIVFTNARRRCHELARRIDADAAAYHAGLDGGERASIEERFADGELAAVVTTAALGAGVDFPASQVIFDALAMGIDWLTVAEFDQMLGRAGRPDYHDRGVVYLLAEPDGVYHGGHDRTEDAVALDLLRGDAEPVAPHYGWRAGVEEVLASLRVAGPDAKRVVEGMRGDVDIERALAHCLDRELIEGLDPTPIGRIAAERFLGPEATVTIRDAVRADRDPDVLVADRELTGP